MGDDETLAGQLTDGHDITCNTMYLQMQYKTIKNIAPLYITILSHPPVDVADFDATPTNTNTTTTTGPTAQQH